MRFSGKSILITGAASGIGVATTALLAREGAARLVLIDRNEAALARLDFGCHLERHAGDVADPELWSRLQLGSIDHAVVNAGVPGLATIVESSFDNWRRVL